MNFDSTVTWETPLTLCTALVQDSDLADDVEDSKSISGDVLCIFGSRTFVPISWMCKKQTSVSNSSTDSELISLDAGLRMHGLFALDLWDTVIKAFNQQQCPTQTDEHTGN